MSTTLETKTVLTSTIFIKASAERIWEALTQPEWTVRYGYAPIVNYDLKPGGKYEACPNEGMKQFPGIPDVICDGEVLEVNAPYYIKQTWRMLMDEQLANEGFTEVTWNITPIRGGVCKVILTHDVSTAPGLANVVSGNCIEHGAGGGWDEILSSLKTLLETGTEMGFLSGPECHTPTHRSIELAKRWTSQSLDGMLKALATTPDDKLNWSPSETSRSALRIAAHAAVVTAGIARTIPVMEGPALPFEEIMKLGAEQSALLTNRAEVEAALKSGCETLLANLDKLTDEQIQGMAQTPFGEVPMESWMLIGSLHIDCHHSQIDYLQTVWGDLEMHM